MFLVGHSTACMFWLRVEGTIRELHTGREGRKKQGKGIFVSQECKPLYRPTRKY